MLETKDFAIKSETGADLTVVQVTAGQSSTDLKTGNLQNNYSR
jgi:SPIRAL1-like protein